MNLVAHDSDFSDLVFDYEVCALRLRDLSKIDDVEAAEVDDYKHIKRSLEIEILEYLMKSSSSI